MALTSFSEDQLGTDNFCKTLTDIITTTGKICLKTIRKNTRNKNKKHHKMGFDEECKMMKKHLLQLGKLITKHPKDQTIYGHFISQKKKFKKLVKQKFQESKEQILNEIMNLENKDPKKFWKLLNDLRNKKKENSNPIDINHWSTYFNNLHNKRDSNKTDQEFNERIIKRLENLINSKQTEYIMDKEFSPDEISSGIQSLKLNKSSGSDTISNEMIKTGILSLRPHLCNLFNHILSSECYPKLWSKSYIVPIFKKGNHNDPANYRGISIGSCTGKLFTLLMNKRLQNFIHNNDIISKYQIGFSKNKRTSDHVFVLKCIIEEAKAKKYPVYGCFVDFRKAFDKVWIDGLLYKIISKYSISSKFVRLLRCMYNNLTAQVHSNGTLGSLFNVTIGTRQGCNLSPSLFNIYTNDLPLILRKANCDPVSLNSKPINTLMYADDMLIMSKTPMGINKSLNILGIYCKKWKLEINTDKTKIIIFNKSKTTNLEFNINGKLLEIVNSYQYLGIKINRSGSFIPTIKDLSDKACRAYFAMSNSFSNMNLNPKLVLKLFDSLIKPIALYGSEVWGAFGHKETTMNNLFTSLFSKYSAPYEQLHLKTCKRAVRVSKNVSNLGVLSELGRFPLIYNIIVAIGIYRTRLETFTENDLLYHALESQHKLVRNSNKTATYFNFTSNIMNQLNCSENINSELNNCHNIKNSTFKNRISKLLKKACISKFIDHFKISLAKLKDQTDTKLTIFLNVKRYYKYESYLNFFPGSQSIIQFRLSDHFLPIERGRYAKPKVPRDMRICNMCRSGIGDELHFLFKCQNTEIRNLHNSAMEKIYKISNQFSSLSDSEKLLYLFKAADKDIIPILSDWLNKLNKTCKNTP